MRSENAHGLAAPCMLYSKPSRRGLNKGTIEAPISTMTLEEARSTLSLFRTA